MEYKTTNNFAKAQSKYGVNQNNNQDLLSKLSSLYKTMGMYGKLKKTTDTAQFGRKVAEHYRQNQKPDWLKEYMPTHSKTLGEITGRKAMGNTPALEGYAPVEDGFFGMMKNMYNPSSEFSTLYDLGNVALEQGTTQLASEGMSAEALSGANQGAMGSAMSSPYAPVILALLGLGIGAGKEGSTLNRWNKDLT